jgi:hypothetical protein
MDGNAGTPLMLTQLQHIHHTNRASLRLAYWELVKFFILFRCLHFITVRSEADHKTK